MKYPEFREIVNMPEATISTQDREIDVVTTNLLVLPNSGYDYGPATGAKTGTSPQAGFCVVATAQSGDESYIAVVLDAAEDLQRFEAATTALEYGFGEYEHEPLVERREPYAELELPYRRGETVKLVAAKDVPRSPALASRSCGARRRRRRRPPPKPGARWAPSGFGGRPQRRQQPPGRPERLRRGLPVAEGNVLGRGTEALDHVPLSRSAG